MIEDKIQPALVNMTFRGFNNMASVYNFFSLPVISTGRSFAYYRKIFFSKQCPRNVLSSLADKKIVDIGCGLTPYVSNSMFQACHKAGVEFYGVDPKLAAGFKFGLFDRAKIRAVGGGGMNKDAPGLKRCIGTFANDLPFEDKSVDLFLSCYVLFVWISDEEILESIFSEFLRVLKPGGEVRIYPAPYYCKDEIKKPGLRALMQQFEVKQQFSTNLALIGKYPPAYMRTMIKK
jgi:SAM-dependent methyltransferase